MDAKLGLANASLVSESVAAAASEFGLPPFPDADLAASVGAVVERALRDPGSQSLPPTWTASWEPSSWNDEPALRLACSNYLLSGKESYPFVRAAGSLFRFEGISLMRAEEAGEVAFALEYRPLRSPEESASWWAESGSRWTSGRPRCLDLDEPGLANALAEERTCLAAASHPALRARRNGPL